jgi:hypothetical protein
LRSAIIPTPRQQGVEEPKGGSTAPNWTWARLLKRVFAIDMERCPVCQQGRLRIIAAIMERGVIEKILRHLKLAVDPRPLRQRGKPRLRGSFEPVTFTPGPTCALLRTFSLLSCFFPTLLPSFALVGKPLSVRSRRSRWPQSALSGLHSSI